jgi:acyl transferase domain-containing protein
LNRVLLTIFQIILDSAESAYSAYGYTLPQAKRSSQEGDRHLLIFSASHEASLRRSIENYEHYLFKNPSSLPDLAYTLWARREHLAHRAFAITNGRLPLEVSRPTKVGKDNPMLVFVFTGQGAQWARMGAELLDDFAIVRESFDKMELTLASLPEPCPWRLRDELLKSDKDTNIQNAAYSQPLCTAVQCAMVDLLRSWGITPNAVVGHSSGEIGAAYASGALNLRDAITVGYHRGQCSVSIKRLGGMAAIGLGREEVEPFLKPGVVVGCDNSPESTTISGDVDTLDMVMTSIKSAHPNVLARKLRLDKAYHSRKFEYVEYRC